MKPTRLILLQDGIICLHCKLGCRPPYPPSCQIEQYAVNMDECTVHYWSGRYVDIHFEFTYQIAFVVDLYTQELISGIRTRRLFLFVCRN